MAASAAYITFTPILSDGHVSGPVKTLSNISATSAAFKLAGGQYAIDVIASNYGTVTLQRLGPDGSTYLTATTAFSANGTALVTLPTGIYKVALA